MALGERIELLSDDSKVRTRGALVALEWWMETKKKRKKMGQQGAKRTESRSHQRRDKFESRFFLGCVMIARKVFK